MNIPRKVEQKLTNELWTRSDKSDVDQAFEELGIPIDSGVAEFFRRYWGPFHSRKIGHELLDPIEQDESMLSNTLIMREQYSLENRYVVISTMLGQSVFVYDISTDRVYDVDFEGGLELLQGNQLSPRWETWESFIQDYFD